VARRPGFGLAAPADKPKKPTKKQVKVALDKGISQKIFRGDATVEEAINDIIKFADEDGEADYVFAWENYFAVIKSPDREDSA
jgi:hypothetical protein